MKPGRGEQQSSSIKSSSEGVHSQQNEVRGVLLLKEEGAGTRHVHPTFRPHPDDADATQEHVPSIELAARQFLFNYGAQRGLDILRDRVQDLQVSRRPQRAASRIAPGERAHSAKAGP